VKAAEKIDAAVAEVAAAEAELADVLKTLQRMLRADKIAVTEKIETALLRLRGKREELAKLRDDLIEED
jgi:hypothetical protein